MRKQATAERLENSLPYYNMLAGIWRDMTGKITLTLILILTTISLFGQFPEVVWQQCYDNSVSDQPVSLCETPNGYLVLTQVYNATGTPGFQGLYDFHIRFVDTTGNTLSEKCLGGSKSDNPVSVIQTSDNNFLLFGRTNSDDGDIQTNIYGARDFWVVNIDQQGNILFSKTYGSTGDDIPAKIISTDDGGFMFCGTIESGGGDVTEYFGETDMWLCKCNQQGDIVWQKTIGDERIEKCNDFIINSKGNIIVGGTVQNYHNGYPFFDARLMETGIYGNILWDSCYTDYQKDNEINIIKQLDNQYALLGTKKEIGYTGSKILFLITDSTGNILRSKTFGGWYENYPSYLSLMDDGGFMILGTSLSAPCNNSLPSELTSDIWMIKLTYQGFTKWQQCYGGYGDEVLSQNSVIKLGDYKYLIAASTNSSTSGDVSCNTGDNNRNTWLAELQRCPDYEPEVPEQPTGPDTIWTGNHPETTFYIDPPANAWEFNWKIEPDTAGDITGYGLYAKVEWEPDFIGIAMISAQSANYCGESNWSEPHNTFVFNTIGVDDISGNDKVIKVYPNPASKWVAFDYVMPSYIDGGILTISDVSGREIVRFLLSSAQGQKVWDVRKIESGVYFYTIEAGKLIKSGKVIIK